MPGGAGSSFPRASPPNAAPLAGRAAISKPEWGELDVTSVALLGAKLALGEGELAARQRRDRSAQAGKAFEDIVVDPAPLAPGADGFAGGGVPHHHIGIRADADPPLARIDVEDA